MTPASITGERKIDATTVSFAHVCLRKPLSHLKPTVMCLCMDSPGHIKYETFFTTRQNEANCKLIWRIPCLFSLSACWHRRQKQNSHYIQCHKASWTTLKGAPLASWPDDIWENNIFYFLALCCRDSRWIIYFLCRAQMQLWPQRPGQMRAGPLARSQAAAAAPAGVRDRAGGSGTRGHTALLISHHGRARALQCKNGKVELGEAFYSKGWNFGVVFKIVTRIKSIGLCWFLPL